jgi:drug/metabolite transporter (DMT)-like permease
VIGDYCLFQCYIIIGSRFGQLFMTLAPLAAAFTAWLSLGEQMTAMSILAMLITLSGIAISVLGRGEHHRVSLKLPLNGVLFAIGAAICQGVGLVLSKIGMNYYQASMDGQQAAWLLPFSANFFRCIAGLVGFTLLLYVKEGLRPLREALHDKVDMTAAATTTIFGPFVGVGFSLMAVQYTGAGIASTLMALTPIIIILPSYWLFRQPITLKGVIGALISVVGVSLFFLS